MTVKADVELVLKAEKRWDEDGMGGEGGGENVSESKN